VRLVGLDEATIRGFADHCDWLVVDEKVVEDAVNGCGRENQNGESGFALSALSVQVDACQLLRWRCGHNIPFLAFAVLLVAIVNGVIILGGKGSYRLISGLRNNPLIGRGVATMIVVLGGRLGRWSERRE
jgi:hypothetical protein